MPLSKAMKRYAQAENCILSPFLFSYFVSFGALVLRYQCNSPPKNCGSLTPTIFICYIWHLVIPVNADVCACGSVISLFTISNIKNQIYRN